MLRNQKIKKSTIESCTSTIPCGTHTANEALEALLTQVGRAMEVHETLAELKELKTDDALLPDNSHNSSERF